MDLTLVLFIMCLLVNINSVTHPQSLHLKLQIRIIFDAFLIFQEIKVKTENEETEKKIEDDEDDEIRELSAEERYTKLMDLLNKSKFYSKFLQVS